MKITKCFLIFNFIFIVFFPINPVYSKALSIPSSIEFKLTNSEYNKYLRRSMKAYTDGEIYGEQNIKKKYKKWNKAKIKIDEKTIDVEMRILGDWKDHLRPPQTSLKVKTIESSFHGITRFNLFLPETRKGENEVFWTLMLRYLNFPTLFTRMVDVNLNGNIYKAIFQEDATKEFLERNNFTETVILKANDFEFYLNEEEKEIYANFFSTSFVIDNNNFLKNEVANFIASEAIALKSNSNFEDLVLNEEFFRSIHQKYASHGLGTINRKYIYIPYKKNFLPLYYDGNVQFLPGKTDCNKKIDKEVLSKFTKDFKFLTNKKLSKMQECVFKDIYHLSKNGLKRYENFFTNANDKKLSNYNSIKNKIIYYLNNNQLRELTSDDLIDKLIIYTFVYNNKFFNCYLNTENKKIKFCNEIDSLRYSKYISESGRYQNFGNFKSFPINLGSFNEEIPIVSLKNNSSEYVLDKNVTYYFLANAEISKDLNFIFKNNKSKLYIQGKFENMNFNFIGDFSEDNLTSDDIRYDKNLLTGCVNFFDSKFNQVSIKSLNMICEDSINIKNSLGNLDNIQINNSSYDALDIDFSKIFIQSLNVDNAQNDCLDFSFGEYEIIQAKLNNCGDKGISIGENSKLRLNDGSISRSNIGVASKDDASTNINNVKIDNINICLAAYNKKKEFKGSNINVKNLRCERFVTKLQTDNLSKITISKEN